MKKRVNLNDEILETLEKRYGYSLDYIRKSLRGDRTGIMPRQLIKEYDEMELAAKTAIKEKANQLNP